MVAWIICLQIVNLHDIHKLKNVQSPFTRRNTNYVSVILSVQILDKIRVVLPSIVIN